MSTTAVYHTTVIWQGAHRGHVLMGNGPEMPFSAPPDAQGHAGVLTPEDAFVAAVNTCIMLMFVWAAERFKLALLDYTCRAEGRKEVALDRTELFTDVTLWPRIQVAADGADPAVIRARVEKALRSAQKYSLVANSVKSAVRVQPTIDVVACEAASPGQAR